MSDKDFVSTALHAGETPAFRDYKKTVDMGKFEGSFDSWMTYSQDERELMTAGRQPKIIGGKPLVKSPATLTSERGKTHGDWLDQSRMGFRLKEMMRKSKNWSTLEPHQAEALDMIATKMSRILTGDASEPDHWDDISGYAFLGKSGHAKS